MLDEAKLEEVKKEALSEFIDGYFDGLNEWTLDDDDDNLFPLIDEIEENSREQIRDFCSKFFDENFADLELYVEQVNKHNKSNGNMSNDETWHWAGINFYYTQNDHSIGYWTTKGVEESLGEKLSNNAAKVGEVRLYQRRNGYFFLKFESVQKN